MVQLDEARRRHASCAIERNAQLQAELISDLLDISRVAAGKMDIDRAPVDLVPVVRAALEAAAADFEAKGLELVTEVDPAAGEVLGEPRRLQQVASNLLSNAGKFTPEGGRIEVRLVRHETSARLTVAESLHGRPDGRPRSRAGAADHPTESAARRPSSGTCAVMRVP